MINMVKTIPSIGNIDIDKWDIDTPISDEDRIFRNIKGEIILPISEFFNNGSDDTRQLDYFVMRTKRSYNSDETRSHICRYLNFFEKYYDINKELLMIMYEMKILIDYNRDYSKENFMN